MERMKALVQYAPYDSRYEEVEKPTAGPGEIVLKVKGCGICAGSESISRRNTHLGNL